jgi:hypothetical protein
MAKLKSDDKLYRMVLDLVNRNEIIYGNWEFDIAHHMGKRWPAAYKLAKKNLGDDNPTVTLIADAGRDAVKDPEAFVADLYEVLKYLSKGGQLE